MKPMRGPCSHLRSRGALRRRPATRRRLGLFDLYRAGADARGGGDHAQDNGRLLRRDRRHHPGDYHFTLNELHDEIAPLAPTEPETEVLEAMRREIEAGDDDEADQ
jgi:hypothetical protein